MFILWNYFHKESTFFTRSREDPKCLTFIVWPKSENIELVDMFLTARKLKTSLFQHSRSIFCHFHYYFPKGSASKKPNSHLTWLDDKGTSVFAPFNLWLTSEKFAVFWSTESDNRAVSDFSNFLSTFIALGQLPMKTKELLDNCNEDIPFIYRICFSPTVF